MKRALRDKLQRAIAEVVAPEVDRAVRATHDVELRHRRDLFAAGEREAAVSSARLVRAEMRGARQLEAPLATLEHALSLAPTGGLALEFGVYSGTTLRVIADAGGGREVYGFDSFEGLPEHWRAGFPAGTFGPGMLGERLPEVAGAMLVVGWFDDTLPGFLAEHADPVSFLHVDADLYSSARTVFEHVGPRLVPGSVIVFDEFFNYPGWQEGEYLAWQEFVTDSGWCYDYEAFTLDNEQVVVRLDHREPSAPRVNGKHVAAADIASGNGF